MKCLECEYHGPPVSEYTGPKPCAECVPRDGSPKFRRAGSVDRGELQIPGVCGSGAGIRPRAAGYMSKAKGTKE